MLPPVQRRLIERIQAHTKETKCSKDIQALLEMENYHQQLSSRLALILDSLVPPSLLLSFMCPLQTVQICFPKGPTPAPSSSLHAL